jgi:hypothetical protein
MSHTRSFANMEVTDDTYLEIKTKLLAVDYGHQIEDDGRLCLEGVALIQGGNPPGVLPNKGPYPSAKLRSEWEKMWHSAARREVSLVDWLINCGIRWERERNATN